jgi:pimeloyl-ACP methyl ester carboxylesterase
MTRSKLNRPGTLELTHPEDVLSVHERMLRASSAQGRHIELGSGRRVDVIEAGQGPPVVLLRPTGSLSLMFLPLLERLDGVRAIAVDRPGVGLSDPAYLPPERFREAVVEWLDEVLDALGLDASALVGSSGGGTWALWYALARPDRLRRLVLISAAPLLPGTRAPLPMRIMAAPKVGELLGRLMKPSPAMIVRMAASMGERDTMVYYPDQIEALVAEGNDPVASKANLAELRAVISPFGFRRSLLVQPDELRRLSVPTLLVWGDHDPGGAVRVAEAIADLIPDSRLEVLPAGHLPWLSNPDRTAELVSEFVRAEVSYETEASPPAAVAAGAF